MAANNSYEEAVALIAAANRVVQDPNSVGAALRTISLRLRGTSVEELESAGEDTTGAITSKSKLRGKIKTLSGVDILTDTGAYKSTYQILLEISNVWKEMSDIDQAALLEILAGKNRANTAMAILSNTKDLEKAYVHALEAEGSAHAENEKYLDSIQGKINQFNNALQTMWSNALDDEIVKKFVSLGTTLIQIIDKIGVIGTLLSGLAIGAMIKGKTGPVGLLTTIIELAAEGSTKIREFGTYLKTLVSSSHPVAKAMSDLVASQISLQASNVATEFNEQKLNATQLARKLTTLGLTESVQTLNVAQMSQALQTANIGREQRLAAIQTLGLDTTTKALTATEISNALASAGVSEANIATTLSALGLSTANKGLAASFMALWTAVWPVLAVMAAAGAIYGLVKLFDHLNVTTEELSEELSNLKSELSDITSELTSVEQELEAVQERMAELLALPSLSFVQEEELRKLQKTNAELQRRKQLLKNEEQRVQKRVTEKAIETAESQLSDTSFDGKWYDVALNALKNGVGGAISGFIIGNIPGAIAGGLAGIGTGIWKEIADNQISTEDKLQREIDNYNNLIKEKERIETELTTADDTKKKFLWWDLDSDADNLREDLDKVEKEIKSTEEYIDTTFSELGDHLEGVDYGQGADELLKYYNNLKNKWEIVYGSDGAVSNALQEILSRDQFATLSNQIDSYVEKLQKGDTSAERSIGNLIRNNQDFVNELEASNIDIQDAIDYFVLEEGIFNSDSIEGITAQYAKALNVMNELKDMSASGTFTIGDSQYTWNDFFTQNDTGKFEANAEKFSEILKGMDKDCRTTFMSLSEQVKNGALTWEQAMESFGHSGTLAGLKVLEAQIVDLNNTEFSGISDQLSGVIDTFSEFGAALDSVAASMDLLNKAQIQMNNTGRISVLTALEIINSTDRWNEILQIENGNIRLVGNATEVLVEDKLALIKSNLQNALSTVTEQLAMVDATNASDDMAMTMEESTNQAVRKLAGSMAYLTTMTEAYTRAANGEEVNVDHYMALATQAQQEAEDALNWKVNSARAIGTAELEKRKQEIEAQLEMLEGIDTVDEFKNYYDFDENPGDKYDDNGSGSGSDTDDALDNLRKKYENKISHLENQQTYLENEIARMEAEDKQVGKAVYEEQIRLEEEKIDLYEQERAALLEAMNSVAKGSDEWYEYAEAVWEVEHSIQDSTLAVVEFKQAIADLYIDVFGKIEDAFNSQQELYDKQSDYVRNNIEYAELIGQDVSAKSYEQLIDIQKNKQASALAEISSLEYALNLGVNDEGVEFSDEELADMVLRLQDAKLEAQEARNEIASINNELKELYVTAFDKVGEALDALGSLYDDRKSYTEGYMELQELRGEPVSTEAYSYLIENETNSLSANLAALDAQRQKLQDAMANGIEAGSEEWIEMEAEIRATEKAIQDNYIALEQYNEELKNLYSEAFNKVRDSFSDVTDVYDDQQAFIESYIDYLETLGVKVPAEMYERLGDIELEKQQANIQKLADMKNALAKMESEGYTPEDEEWVQAKADIRAVEKAIWDSEVAMAEFNKAIRELETEKFEEFIKRIDDMLNELDRVYNLLSKEDVATEDGAWTKEGIASLGLLYQKMEIAKKQVADYQAEIERLNDEYKSGAISEQEYNDRLVELKNNQWDSIEAYEDAKDAIIDINEARIDMIEEGIQEEIDAYQELIDLKKEELDAERDLYEFRKNIKDQTKDIASLERRIAAMSGSTDAATVAERTKLEAQLREARENLDDTYYSHAMDSQSTALDDENESYVKSKEDYVEMLREALEDVEAIVANTMSQVLINADTVLGELNGVSGEYGITLSESLTAPWISAAQKAEEFKNSALMQEYEFALHNGIFTGEIITSFDNLFGQTTTMATDFQTSVYTVMEAIKLHVDNSTSEMTSDLVIPFNTALGYAQETFSPQTIAELQKVADKAEELVYDESANMEAPWKAGTEAANTFGDNAHKVLQQVAEDAAAYDPTITDALDNPPEAAGSAWDLFGTNVTNLFNRLVTNATNAATQIGDKMDDIIADAQRAASAIANTGRSGGNGGSSGGGTGSNGENSGGGNKTNLPLTTNQHTKTPDEADVKALQTCLNMLFSSGLTVDGKMGSATKSALVKAQRTMYNAGNETMKSQDGLYGTATRAAMVGYINKKITSLREQGGSSMIGQAIQRYNTIKNMLPKAFYAKGTLGTKQDEWAMTDEIGDELVLIPGKGGNLQYMRKGTAVIPADISANLMEWGKLNPNMDMTGAVQGINIMTNVINKPELNLSFENLVHIDNCTNEVVPEVKKIITEQLESFTKKLNYNLKRVGSTSR